MVFWLVLFLLLLLLGMLGSLVYVVLLFGLDILFVIEKSVFLMVYSFFFFSVVNEIIEFIIGDIINNVCGEVVLLGFLILLWVGLLVILVFVDVVVEVYD